MATLKRWPSSNIGASHPPPPPQVNPLPVAAVRDRGGGSVRTQCAIRSTPSQAADRLPHFPSGAGASAKLRTRSRSLTRPRHQVALQTGPKDYRQGVDKKAHEKTRSDPDTDNTARPTDPGEPSPSQIGGNAKTDRVQPAPTPWRFPLPSFPPSPPPESSTQEWGMTQ